MLRKFFNSRYSDGTTKNIVTTMEEMDNLKDIAFQYETIIRALQQAVKSGSYISLKGINGILALVDKEVSMPEDKGNG